MALEFTTVNALQTSVLDTEGDDREEDSFDVLTLFFVIIGCLGIVGNGTVVFVITGSKKMREKPSNALILNQSCIDAMASLALMAIHLSHNENLSGMSGQVFCKVWLSQWLIWGSFMASTYNLVALTLERFFGVVYPIFHKQHVTLNKAIIAAIAAWFIGMVYSIYQVFTAMVENGHCARLSNWPSDLFNQVFGIVNTFVEFLIPLIAMVICYARMAIALKIRISPASTSIQNNQATFHRAKRNVVKTLMLVCTCFFLCWIWNQFFFLMLNLGFPISQIRSTFHQFSILAACFNCCINPFIYAFKFEEFQARLKSLCGRKSGQEPDFNTVSSGLHGSNA